MPRFILGGWFARDETPARMSMPELVLSRQFGMETRYLSRRDSNGAPPPLVPTPIS